MEQQHDTREIHGYVAYAEENMKISPKSDQCHKDDGAGGGGEVYFVPHDIMKEKKRSFP